MIGFVPGSGGPMFYYLAACVAGGLAFVLLMVVMRGLLESAIAVRTELDEVNLMAVIVELDVMLARRKMSWATLANRRRHHPGERRRFEERARSGHPVSPPWTRSAGCSIASRVTSSGGPPTRPPSGNAPEVGNPQHHLRCQGHCSTADAAQVASAT